MPEVEAISPRRRLSAIQSGLAAKKLIYIFSGLALVLAVIVVSISVGTADLTVPDVINAILAKMRLANAVSPENEAIIWYLRMPRVLMGCLAGFGLAISGTAMQSITRNPLVSPFTLGVSSAAAFGASLAIILGFNFIGIQKYLIVIFAFAFALMSTALSYGIARLRNMTPEALILGGVALMFLFSALTSFVQYMSTEQQLARIVHWTFGSLAEVKWEEIGMVAIFIGICFPIMLFRSWDLNVMSSGNDDVARSLAVNPRNTRVTMMLLSSLVTACIICFTGTIGFVCLVSPHIARMIVGSDHKFAIPFSGIIGAVLLIFADTIGRTVMSPVTIPVGIIVSFIGAPMFIYLLLTRKREM